MSVSVHPFGALPDGNDVGLYMLENFDGTRVGILNYGAIIHSLELPCGKRGRIDVVLGHVGIDNYLINKENLGAAIGRNANRVENARLTLRRKRYELQPNSGHHNLHSGTNGFSHRLYGAEIGEDKGQPLLRLHCVVEHLSDGYPGDLDLSITYTLTDDNSLCIEYHAVSDMDTVCSPTNHSYFNLAGHDGEPVYNHLLQIEADFYTPFRRDKIPTGEVLRVEGTPYDFTAAKLIGRDIDVDYQHMKEFVGYDVNYALSGRGLRRVATLADSKSGREMEVYTDMPGLQLFTGNSLNPEVTRKNGARYARHQGVCLETQYFPDSVNRPWFPSPLLPAGQKFESTTAYRFRCS